jgi:hypothetical protein
MIETIRMNRYMAEKRKKKKRYTIRDPKRQMEPTREKKPRTVNFQPTLVDLINRQFLVKLRPQQY